MTIPTVTIITPCYNGSAFLAETIESALAQTHAPLEMIVIDDGSTDNSAEIAESSGPPVRVIRQENQGESVARNVGIAAANGSHCLFLDADDLLHPHALERLINAVSDDPSAVALMSCAVFITDIKSPERVDKPSAHSFFPAVISQNLGAVHAWLTPTKIVRNAGGFCDSLVYFEDWDFWCQVALAGGKLVPIDFVGAYYRRHPGAQTPSAKKVDRKLGHVTVIKRLLDGMLQQPALLGEYGEAAFWSSWVALKSARDLGIGWADLQPLINCMKLLLQRGPQSLDHSRFVQVCRILGIRNAMRIWTMARLNGDDSNEAGPKMIERLQSMQPETTSP